MLKEQADEYAALIMEELDPENLGYIEVNRGHPIPSSPFHLRVDRCIAFQRCCAFSFFF